MKSSKIAQTFDGYSKQDTADKLILSYFAATHGFPTPDTPWLDFHFFRAADAQLNPYPALAK